MKLIKKKPNNIPFTIGMMCLLIILVSLLAGCGHTGSSSSQSFLDNTVTNLGTVNNSSVLYVSSNNFNVNSKSQQKGVIGITNSDIPFRGSVSFFVTKAAIESIENSSNNLPTITTIPSNCILDSSLVEQNTCDIVVDGNNASSGQYVVTPVVTSQDNIVKTLNSFLITTSSSSSLKNLSISFPNGNNVQSGESIPVDIFLNIGNESNSYNVNVKIIPNDIAKLSQNSCQLSYSNNKCSVNIIGIKSGVAQIFAKTNIDSSMINPVVGNFVIDQAIVPGDLTISLDQSRTYINNRIDAVVKLNNSKNVNDLPVKIFPSKPNLATIVGKDCILSSHNVGKDYCTVGIVTESKSGSITLSASSNKYNAVTSQILQISKYKQRYLYVANFDNYLWKCTLSDDGTINKCKNLISTTVFNKTENVRFYDFNNKTYAYIADDSNILWRCEMSDTGDFSGTCTQLANNFNKVTGITFAEFNKQTYMYVADHSDKISLCKMNDNGELDNSYGTNGCVSLLPGGFGNFQESMPINLSSTLQNFDNKSYIFIATEDTKPYRYFWQCQINDNTGEFIESAPCQKKYPYQSIYGITFKTFKGVTQAYIAQIANHVDQYSIDQFINNSGSYTSYGNLHFPNVPYWIEIENFRDTNYTYIASGDYQVIRCPLNDEGIFENKDNCQYLFDSLDAEFRSVRGITFHEFY